MTNAKKIRRMLAEGKTAKEISKKLGVPNSYVHTIKWQDKKTSKIIGAVFDATRDVRKAKENNKIIKKPNLSWLSEAREIDHELEEARRDGTLLKNGVPVNDLVNKPPHYTTGGIDFLDYAEAKGLTENAYLFNVVKYVSRAGKKVGSDPIEDLKKAQFYLNREIAIRERA